MNKFKLACVFPVYSKVTGNRCRSSPSKVVGYRAVWGSHKANKISNKWSFKTKLFQKIHTMVAHEAPGGKSMSWVRAGNLADAHAPMFKFQTEHV